MDSIYSIFASRLKTVLKKNGMKDKQLADALDVSTTTVSNYTNGKNVASIDNLIKLSSILGVSIDYLLGNDNQLHSKSEISPEDLFRNLVVIVDRLGMDVVEDPNSDIKFSIQYSPLDKAKDFSEEWTANFYLSFFCLVDKISRFAEARSYNTKRIRHSCGELHSSEYCR